NGRLAVIGIARMQLLHCLFISHGAGAVVEFVAVLVKRPYGSNVVAFALGFGADGLRLLDGPCTCLQLRRTGCFPNGMVVGHGNSPIGHPARRIFLGHGSKRFAGFLVPKRMEHGDGTAELRLHRWIAGNGTTHFAEFRWVACGVLMLMLGNSWCYESRADGATTPWLLDLRRPKSP